MKLYKALFVPALLLCGAFNSYAAGAEDNIAHDYVTHWNDVLNGQTVSILQTEQIDSDIVTNCKTLAPKQFRSEIIHQWEHKTGAKMTQTAFLSEDLQRFDRLAAISCMEGADYQRKGNGDELIQALSAHLLDMDTKDGNDAYEQTKTMEFQTGIITARYGISIEKNKLKSSH